MKYIKICKDYTKDDIISSAEIIKNGGVAIIPTDTVYGIAADAINEEAIKNIYELKNREYSKPMNILVSDIGMIKKVTKGISQKEEEIIKKYMPGAITIILKKNEVIPSIVTAGKETIGIRIPNNKYILELIENIGRPIVATSLNLSGEESMTDLEMLPDKFKYNVDLIIDEGKTKGGIASTIIKIEKNVVKTLREGPVKIK